LNEIVLPLLFFIVSFIYSSVGLGGGSAYTALMVIFGLNYKIIPTTSLTLNIFVSSLGIINFWRYGYGRINLILPFLITSVPMTYLGGKLDLSEDFFYFILFCSLLVMTTKIYFFNSTKISLKLYGLRKWSFIFLSGGILGFIAGTVGIGGGIYLVPLIFIFGLGTEKEAAAAGIVFIFVNSIVGIIPRFQLQDINFGIITPLIIAVMIGGLLGSYVGSVKFKSNTIQKIMGIILIIGIYSLLSKII
tara:strand:- start:192 stop:932 length:741 start_codon:yes stop_codon:yes gene_type:complete